MNGTKQMTWFTEASLSDSKIYQELNKSSRVSTTIINAIQTGVVVDRSYIEEQIIQCKRSRLSPLLEQVLAAYEKEEIKLIYNKNVRVSTSLPFVVINTKQGTKVFIFISDFASLTKDKEALSIEMKKLYVLMEAAYVGLKFYTRPDLFRRSTSLMKIFSSIYAGMSIRLFNREFALSLDKDLTDKVTYSVARFCLEAMCGMTNNAIIHAYAENACLNPNSVIMNLIEQGYKQAVIVTIDNLVHYIKTLSPKLEKLNFRYYFERWVGTYGTGSTMSIDALPYLYYVIINTLLRCFLINTQTVNEIVTNTKGINVFYSEVSKIIS